MSLAAATSEIERLQSGLVDRYTIEREIGRGGMATVYLAHDLKHDRQVAIKVLNSDLSMAMGAERFSREIELAGSLEHPNILPMYESGESNGSVFYVMPYVEGESLAAKLIREKQLAVDESVRIACEVAEALDYAHKRGVVHRDIKPENILLDNGRAVVADFGIARAMSAPDNQQKLTKTGLSLGTPTYMSPEQALAERDIDGRSDVYSLGCVLYEMLIGQPPFVGPTAQAIVARQMLDEVPSLTVVRGSIPDELEDAVLRALSKTPADRYSSAADFAAALKAAQASGGGTLGSSERRSRPRMTTAQRTLLARRKKMQMRAGMAGIGLLLIAGVAVFLWSRSGSAAGAAEQVGFAPNRIAVLYFADQSRNGELSYLADGLTEALIDELRQVKNLDVVSSNGVAQFRGEELARDSIARALSAGTLVDGSVEAISGNRLRIDVRLIDGNSGSDLGNRRSFEQAAGDLLGIRNTLVSTVAALVRERVGDEVKLLEQRAGTRNVSAWSLVRQAEGNRKEAGAARARGDFEEMRRRYAVADSLLEQAERLDPSWTEPVIQRGLIRANLAGSTGDRLETARYTDEGIAHAERALAMDAQSAGALELRGQLRYSRYYYQVEASPAESDRLLAQAEADLRAAVQIDRSRANAWYQLSHLNYIKADVVQAKLAARNAYEEDAYLAVAQDILWVLFITSYSLEQWPDAIQYCGEGGRRFAGDYRFRECQLMLLASRAREPDIPAAWQLVAQIESLVPAGSRDFRTRRVHMFTAVVIGRAGQADSARRVITRARATRGLDPGGELLQLEAFARLTLGDKDEALRALSQYLTDNPAQREGQGKDDNWWWRDLRDDPRYQALLGTT